MLVLGNFFENEEDLTCGGNMRNIEFQDILGLLDFEEAFRKEVISVVLLLLHVPDDHTHVVSQALLGLILTKELLELDFLQALE